MQKLSLEAYFIFSRLLSQDVTLKRCHALRRSESFDKKKKKKKNKILKEKLKSFNFSYVEGFSV